MKIQLVDDSRQSATSSSAAAEPTTYRACPLCDGPDWADVPSRSGANGGAEVAKAWRVCETCGHLHSATYTTGSAQAESASAGAPRPGFEAVTSATARQMAGRIVHRVCELRATIDGLWLDAVAQEGALLGAASEYGHDVLGLDSDPARVTSLVQSGLPAQCMSLEGLDGAELFDVISLVNCLERSPFPGALLAQARRLLRPDGVLFLSLPNVDSQYWRELDASGTNPYWEQPDLFHCFSREHLFWLLRRNGFEPCDFAISELTPVGMDVCAARTEDFATGV